MVMDLCFQLRSQQKLAACITVTIRYSNFETHTKQAKIPYTSLDSLIISRVKDLFDKVYNRRMLIRLVGVKLSQLVNGYEQMNLYTTSEEQYRLYQAMDRIRNRFGEKSLKLASTINLKL